MPTDDLDLSDVPAAPLPPLPVAALSKTGRTLYLQRFGTKVEVMAQGDDGSGVLALLEAVPALFDALEEARDAASDLRDKLAQALADLEDATAPEEA